MLTRSKQKKLLSALKGYHKKYLGKQYTDLDESGTRLMVNSFLTDVLGFTSIEEVKTEYMIRGTYADYVIQTKGERHFLVEVKSMSLNLSDKHLRQAINYGANEGIEWTLLTNGKIFDFYKILFTKPIEAKKIFSVDLSDQSQIKNHIDVLQYLHKESILKKGLSVLWNKYSALEPTNIAGLLNSQQIINFIKRQLRKKYKNKFADEEVICAINRVITDKIELENVKTSKFTKGKRRNKKVDETKTAETNQKSLQNSPTDSDAIVDTGCISKS